MYFKHTEKPRMGWSDMEVSDCDTVFLIYTSHEIKTSLRQMQTSTRRESKSQIYCSRNTKTGKKAKAKGLFQMNFDSLFKKQDRQASINVAWSINIRG